MKTISNFILKIRRPKSIDTLPSYRTMRVHHFRVFSWGLEDVSISTMKCKVVLRVVYWQHPDVCQRSSWVAVRSTWAWTWIRLILRPAYERMAGTWWRSGKQSIPREESSTTRGTWCPSTSPTRRISSALFRPVICLTTPWRPPIHPRWRTWRRKR